jgi:hypothetical protein
MEISFNELPLLIGLAIVFFAMYFFFYRKFLYSIVDPLFTWIITTAFASILVIQVVPTIEDAVHFFGCQISLWLGFFLIYRKPDLSPYKDPIKLESASFSDDLLLEKLTYILFVLYLISNIVIGYSKGFALFSDTPTESKIANFQNGFGIFRKINWGVGTFVLTALIYLTLLKKSLIHIFLLCVVVILSSLDGSKASLLKIAVAAGVVLYHPALKDKRSALKKIKLYFPLFVILATGIFFYVLLKENENINDAYLAFIKRLLYSADSVLYYYTPVNIEYFSRYSFGDYIIRITNPILGFFRLQEYRESPGNLMVENLIPPGASMNVIVGPNAPFYIEGRIYLNYWLAFPYSALIGYLYASLRRYYFSINMNNSAFYFIYIASLLQLSNALLIDTNLAVTQTFDLTFFVVPTYIIVSFAFLRKLRIRFNSN